MNLQPIILPDGRDVLHLIEIGRVSRPSQDKQNIAASFQYAERTLAEIWTGKIITRRFGEQASGMLVARKTILQAYELIEQGWADLVLMEDVSRAYRNPRWIIAFIQDCVDAGVRVIAPGDGLDTADENWEVLLPAAAFRHGTHIPDTRRRIRRTATQAFERGGMVLRVRFGWKELSPEEASSGIFGPQGLRIARIPELTPVFHELRRRVLAGESAVAMAEWLNSDGLDGNGLKPGPYCKQRVFNARLVIDMLRDPLCYGLRQFRKINYRMQFKTGTNVRSPNPNPLNKHYPELAHMTKEEWDEMVAVLDRSSGRGSQKSGPEHVRFRMARKDSLTGLQHVRCAICGEFFYPIGIGKMKCKSALADNAYKTCWNHVLVSQEKLREKLVDILVKRIEQFPRAMNALIDSAWEQIDVARKKTRHAQVALDQEIADLENQAGRITDAIAQGGGELPHLLERLKTLNAALHQATQKREQNADATLDGRFPANRKALSFDLRNALLELSNMSYPFASLMRKVFPKILVQPIQTLDHGQVYPRVMMTLDLSALNAPESNGDRQEPVESQVDLFDPPVHIGHLHSIIETRDELLSQGKKASLDRLGNRLSLGRMTIRRALGYQRLMVKEGISDCYRTLQAKPAYASRWKPRSPKTSPSDLAIGGTI